MRIATGIDHVAMGRFGNVMLTVGETNLALNARVGEIVVGAQGAHVLEFARTMPGLDPISD